MQHNIFRHGYDSQGFFFSSNIHHLREVLYIYFFPLIYRAFKFRVGRCRFTFTYAFSSNFITTFLKYLDQNFISVNKQHSLIKAAEVPQCKYFLTHLISLQLSALRKLLSGLVTRIVRWLFHLE